MNIVAALVLLIASSITSVFYFKTKKSDDVQLNAYH